eukprot:5394989-Pleurochrysis_carterae.AAC.1
MAEIDDRILVQAGLEQHLDGVAYARICTHAQGPADYTNVIYLIRQNVSKRKPQCMEISTFAPQGG